MLPNNCNPSLDTMLRLVLFILAVLDVRARATLIDAHELSKDLQRAVRYDEVVIVLKGVRQRMQGTPSPDPLILINFPDIDNQFKVHLLEETGAVKLTLVHEDGR